MSSSSDAPGAGRPKGSIADVYHRADVSAANVKATKAAERAHARKGRAVAPSAVVATLAGFHGETPTIERAVKSGVERVCTGRIDSAQRFSQAVRAANSWWPQTLYERGRLTKRQYHAACRLMEDWERARFDAMRGQPWDIPVDHSGGGGEASGRTHACRRAVGRILSTLLPVERGVVQLVVVQGRTIESALELPMLREMVMCRANKALTYAASALLAAALERVAICYGM